MTRTAVLIVDLCGFSRLMREAGVPAARDAVARLQAAASAATQAHGGRVVKFWADNVMAAFPTIAQAQAAAAQTLANVNAAAGIGWGEVVDEGLDLWGDEVNEACRLGEDIAERGEVLLTDAARAAFAGVGADQLGGA